MTTSLWDEPIIIYDEPHGPEVFVIENRGGRPRREYRLNFAALEADTALSNEPDLVECLRINGWLDHGPGRDIGLRYGWLQPGSGTITDALVLLRDDIAERMRRELRTNADAVDQLSPYDFERLIAEILRDVGYDVRFTPKSRDGGRDILAYAHLPAALKCLVLVECKKWRRDRRIEPSIVKQFLFTLREQDRATRGMLVTTASFTSGARALEQEYSWILSLHDQAVLQEWLRRYGSWEASGPGEVWIPTGRLMRAEQPPNKALQPTSRTGRKKT